MRHRTVFHITAFAAAVSAFAPGAAAAIVWQRFATPNQIALVNEPGETDSAVELPGGGETHSQLAQRLTLAGTDRFVTTLEMRLWAFNASTGSGNCTASFTALLYTVDASNKPGTLLWSGTATGLSVVHSNSGSTATAITLTPNVSVPSDVYLAFSLQSIVNQRAVMGASCESVGAGGIGGVSSTWMLKSSATGLWSPDTFLPDPVMEARITAIPSPAFAGLAGLGFLALARRSG